MYGLVGCAPVPFEMREVKTAPRSQEQAGYLVFKASLDEIRTRLEGKEFRWRELNSKHHLYEIYGLGKEEIVAAFPHAKVEENQVLQLISGDQVNSEANYGALASAESKKKVSLPPSFEECENTPHSQRPRSIFVSIKASHRLKFSKDHPPILTMKRSAGKPVQELLKWKSLSRPGPNGQSILNLKHKWYYKPPVGSIVKPQLLDGRKFDTVVDTVGTHLLALRVEDESRACAVQTISFLSTANIPYQVPRLHIEDLRQEFKLKELTSYLDRIQGRESWKYSRGEGVVIAIIDSGLNYNHPLVAHNVKINEGEIPGNGLDDDQNGYVDDYTGFDFYHNDAYPFDDGGHGSRVAGLAASAIGLAQNAQVLPIKVSAFREI